MIESYTRISNLPGFHYVGKMGDGEMMRVLFDQISEGQVQWTRIEKEYDQVHYSYGYILLINMHRVSPRNLSLSTLYMMIKIS